MRQDRSEPEAMDTYRCEMREGDSSFFAAISLIPLYGIRQNSARIPSGILLFVFKMIALFL